MRYIVLILLLAHLACSQRNGSKEIITQQAPWDTTAADENAAGKTNTIQPAAYVAGTTINTGNVTPQQLIAYATTLIGTPYKYGSTDPSVGFDCSGFITHVFNHFNIAVPRSSVDFTNMQKEVALTEAKPGDLILFTGTDSTIRTVGHMGIITSAGSDGVAFIHSTSGKMYGVTITQLNPYYMGRFMKVIHVFKQ